MTFGWWLRLLLCWFGMCGKNAIGEFFVIRAYLFKRLSGRSNMIEYGICEVVNSNCRIKLTTQFTNWDNEIQKKWARLKPPTENITSKSNVRREAKWLAPRRGRVKLNFDGAAKGNLGPGGARCIIRNDKGECIWALSRTLGVTINNEAEIEARARGLWLCLEKGIRNVDIEGDSQYASISLAKNSPRIGSLMDQEDLAVPGQFREILVNSCL